MRVRLQEDPREWQKFTAVMAVVAALLVLPLRRKGALSPGLAVGAWLTLAGAVVLSLLQPAWFRGFYRAGMRASAAVGTVMGTLLMAVMFIVVLTPLGWLLRLAGKDLLRLRRDTDASSYWQPARPNIDLDRMF